VSLLVAVASFAERYDRMYPKRIEYSGYCVDWDSWLTDDRDLGLDRRWCRQCDQNQKARHHKL
jgi:hypothetical protein